MNYNPGGEVPQLNTNDCTQLVCCQCGHDSFVMQREIYIIPRCYRAYFNNQEMIFCDYAYCAECGTRQTPTSIPGEETVPTMVERGAKSQLAIS